MTKQITVLVHKRTNLEEAQKILASALGHAGCPHCYSGFRLTFEDAVDPESQIFVTAKDNVSVGPLVGAEKAGG